MWTEYQNIIIKADFDEFNAGDEVSFSYNIIQPGIRGIWKIRIKQNDTVIEKQVSAIWAYNYFYPFKLQLHSYID